MFGIVNFYWLLLIGLAGGTFGGMLGLGSGVVVVPALVLGLGFSQKVAQGTCLAMMVPMALMGAFRYYVNPELSISMGVIVVLAIGAVVGANLGSSLAAWMPTLMLKKVFGVTLLLVGAQMLLR
jgi:uncharacterized membrane protein YfcA